MISPDQRSAYRLVTPLFFIFSPSFSLQNANNINIKFLSPPVAIIPNILYSLYLTIFTISLYNSLNFASHFIILFNSIFKFILFNLFHRSLLAFLLFSLYLAHFFLFIFLPPFSTAFFSFFLLFILFAANPKNRY